MRSAFLACLVAAGAALAGCGGSHASNTAQSDPGGNPAVGGPNATPTPPPVRVAIRAGHGRIDNRPDRGITVRAHGGTLDKVSVRSGGDVVEGTLNDAKTVWRTRWALGVSKTYKVKATGTSPSGDPVTQRRTVRTLTPEHTFAPRTILIDHGTYGVGMPLIFYFDDPVTNRKAVERSLDVRTTKPVTGSWYWDDECGIVPTCLYFRPRHYWKPNTQVHWTAHVNGVQAAPGVFGTTDLSGTIDIGRSLKVVASTAGHYMDVYKDGKKYAHWPISTGKPGDDTPNGTYLSIEKHNPEEMIGEGYDLSVPYSVRITWSGIYLHAASWSVGSQGYSNVSHGCINMSPEDAAIYYDMSIPGDPARSRAAHAPARSTTAGPCGSRPGKNGNRAARCTRPCAPASTAARSSRRFRRCRRTGCVRAARPPGRPGARRASRSRRRSRPSSTSRRSTGAAAARRTRRVPSGR